MMQFASKTSDAVSGPCLFEFPHETAIAQFSQEEAQQIPL